MPRRVGAGSRPKFEAIPEANAWRNLGKKSGRRCNLVVYGTWSQLHYADVPLNEYSGRSQGGSRRPYSSEPSVAGTEHSHRYPDEGGRHLPKGRSGSRAVSMGNAGGQCDREFFRPEGALVPYKQSHGGEITRRTDREF